MSTCIIRQGMAYVSLERMKNYKNRWSIVNILRKRYGGEYMAPLTLSVTEVITLLGVVTGVYSVMKVLALRWQNERLRAANRELRRELR